MAHVLLIGIFVVIIACDVDPRLDESLSQRVEAWGLPVVASTYLLAMGGIWLVTHLYVRRCARRLDRVGDARFVWRAERGVGISRAVATVVHAVGVLWLGWLVVVRRLVGDLILVDDLIAVLPALLVFVAGWASLYPIDRRVREALIIRSLDEGRPIEPYVSFGAHVMSFVRHQLGLICVPIVLVLGWSEFVAVVGSRYWPGPADAAQGVLVGVQLVGAIAIFILVPTIMRHVWRTRTLEDGELRRALRDLCAQQRVRVRELLVWNTHGVLVNGAVMGLLGWMRYVLLSDGLLMGLSRRQVEAVAAHEVGHIRRRHIPWLAGGVVTVLILAGFVADWLVLRALRLEIGGALELLALVGTPLAIAGVAFGWVSRRFEWQADAFAAQHLSGARPGRSDVVIDPAAADAMVGALGAVARLNHIPRHARSWRHGSIATRQGKLLDLVGRRADGLPIDRQVARIKAGIAIGAVLAMVVIGLDLAGAFGTG